MTSPITCIYTCPNTLSFLQILPVPVLALLIWPDKLDQETWTKQYSLLLGESFQTLGLAYQQLGKLGEALYCRWCALQIFKTEGEPAQTGQALIQLSILYRQLGLPEAAQQILQWATEILETVPTEQEHAEGLHLAGIAWYRLGESQLALKCLGRALLIRAGLENELEEADTLQAIGAVYLQAGQVANGLNYYQRSLQIYRDLKMASDAPIRVLEQEAMVLKRIARVYHGLELYTWEIECYHQSLEILNVLEQATPTAEILDYLGDAQVHISAWIPALEAYQQALHQLRLTDNCDAESRILQKIQDIYGQVHNPIESV